MSNIEARSSSSGVRTMSPGRSSPARGPSTPGRASPESFSARPTAPQAQRSFESVKPLTSVRTQLERNNPISSNRSSNRESIKPKVETKPTILTSRNQTSRGSERFAQLGITREHRVNPSINRSDRQIARSEILGMTKIVENKPQPKAEFNSTKFPRHELSSRPINESTVSSHEVRQLRIESTPKSPNPELAKALKNQLPKGSERYTKPTEVLAKLQQQKAKATESRPNITRAINANPKEKAAQIVNETKTPKAELAKRAEQQQKEPGSKPKLNPEVRQKIKDQLKKTLDNKAKISVDKMRSQVQQLKNAELTTGKFQNAIAVKTVEQNLKAVRQELAKNQPNINEKQLSQAVAEKVVNVEAKLDQKQIRELIKKDTEIPTSEAKNVFQTKETQAKVKAELVADPKLAEKLLEKQLTELKITPQTEQSKKSQATTVETAIKLEQLIATTPELAQSTKIAEQLVALKQEIAIQIEVAQTKTVIEKLHEVGQTSTEILTAIQQANESKGSSLEQAKIEQLIEEITHQTIEIEPGDPIIPPPEDELDENPEKPEDEPLKEEEFYLQIYEEIQFARDRKTFEYRKALLKSAAEVAVETNKELGFEGEKVTGGQIVALMPTIPQDKGVLSEVAPGEKDGSYEQLIESVAQAGEFSSLESAIVYIHNLNEANEPVEISNAEPKVDYQAYLKVIYGRGYSQKRIAQVMDALPQAA